jgi:hypothetical protein
MSTTTGQHVPVATATTTTTATDSSKPYAMTKERRDAIKEAAQRAGLNVNNHQRQLATPAQKDEIQKAALRFGLKPVEYQGRIYSIEKEQDRNWETYNYLNKKRPSTDNPILTPHKRKRSAEATQSQVGSSSRGAEPSVFVQETENDVAMTGAQDLVVQSSEGVVVPVWYRNLDPKKSRAYKAWEKNKKSTPAQLIKPLEGMKGRIAQSQTETDPIKLAELFEQLRDDVHKAEFASVNQFVLRRCHMMKNGLDCIVNMTNNVKYPWDLQADAFQLYKRWSAEVFEINLLRGLEWAPGPKGNKRNADRIDQTWRSQYGGVANFYGHGDFVQGQWWPTQLTTVRDGAHGSPQAGIYGEKGKGAFSIVLSGGNHYGDVDNGDDIMYSGTNSVTEALTGSTQRMIESCDEIKEPVRVIRSWNLDRKNPYRPLRGFRYDGLYDVVGYTVVDVTQASYQFHLVRCPGQPPIRHEDNAARRPTRFEIEAYDKEIAAKGYS